MSREELVQIIQTAVETAVQAAVPPAVEAAVQPLRKDIHGLRGELTDLRGDVTELRGDVTELRRDVTEFRDEFRASINHLSKAVEPIAELTRRLIDVQMTFPQMLEEKLAETKDHITSHIDQLYKREERQQQEEHLLNEQFRRHRKRQRKQARRLDEAETAQTDHEVRIQRLEEAG
ncbi:MAG TPA: hypothetical protein VGO93_25345 [Candidatus Xenobia bacterium]